MLRDHAGEHTAANLHQVGRRIKLDNAAPIQHHDAIIVKNGVQPVRNRDDRAVFEAVAQRALNQFVGLHVY